MEPIATQLADGTRLRQVRGHVGYGVSECGEVYRLLHRGKPIPTEKLAPLSPYCANKKSRKPHVRIGGENLRLAYVVAWSWLPDPGWDAAKLPVLNNKDGDRWNCEAGNLEWK